MLPPYVYDLIAAVQRFEDEHGDTTMCFDGVLAAVPADEQHAARVLAAYKLEHDRQPSPMQAAIAPAVAAVGGDTYRLPGGRAPRCRCAPTATMPDENGVRLEIASLVLTAVGRIHAGACKPKMILVHEADREAFDLGPNCEVSGLTVYTDDRVPRGHIRITVDQGDSVDIPVGVRSLAECLDERLVRAFDFNARYRLGTISAFHFDPDDAEQLGITDGETRYFFRTRYVMKVDDAVPAGYLRIYMGSSWRDTSLSTPPTEA